MTTLLPFLIGSVISLFFAWKAGRLHAKIQKARQGYDTRKLAQLQQQWMQTVLIAAAAVLCGILGSLVIWSGPEGIEAIRVFMAPRYRIIPE